MSFTASFPRLVLASASPRRRELLHAAGFDFDVHAADIDEEDHPDHLLPADLAEWLAQQKAQVIAARFPRSLVIGADTVVAFGDAVLGKPCDADHARQMLTLLGGSTHLTLTGVALIRVDPPMRVSTRVTSAVSMRRLEPWEIDRYIATGDWQGKAGGYGIQDNDPFVTRVSGSFTNIVGLPMERLTETLAAAGVRPRPT